MRNVVAKKEAEYATLPLPPDHNLQLQELNEKANDLHQQVGLEGWARGRRDRGWK